MDRYDLYLILLYKTLYYRYKISLYRISYFLQKSVQYNLCVIGN